MSSNTPPVRKRWKLNERTTRRTLYFDGRNDLKLIEAAWKREAIAGNDPCLKRRSHPRGTGEDWRFPISKSLSESKSYTRFFRTKILSLGYISGPFIEELSSDIGVGGGG